MGGELAATLPLASAALTDGRRIMRIVAAIEVDPAHGLDAYFTCSKAVRRASGELELDQVILVSADGTVNPGRTNCPRIAKPEQDETPAVSAMVAAGSLTRYRVRAQGDDVELRTDPIPLV